MLKNIKLSDISITDKYWADKQRLVSGTVLFYQWEVLNDRVSGAVKSYCVENFQKAAQAIKNRTGSSPVYPTDKWKYDESNSEPAAFKGWVFQDSDLYKWLEAACYAVSGKSATPALKSNIETAVGLILSAQEKDGYIDTLYSVNNINARFSNLKDYHELYCFGHLVEAACAHFEAFQDDRLLNAAEKFAELICRTFGDEENRSHGYPGHEVAEMALARLYKLTGNRSYIETAKFFIDSRGQAPYFFDEERGVVTDGRDYIYNQAHKPVRQQEKAVGHAVRAMYLYCGMADAAALTDDSELRDVCVRLWDDVTERKMYITGAVGSSPANEAFAGEYYLPDELAYAETCASVGLMFFADRMLSLDLSSRPGDVAELCLYNNIVGSMSPDGKAFFYSNPLYVDPCSCGTVPALSHVSTVRQSWFGCACCPPNVARLLENLGSFCAYEGTADGENTLLINLFIESEIRTDFADISFGCELSVDGRLAFNIKARESFRLLIRKPSWCHGFKADSEVEESDGFISVRVGKGESTVKLEFEMVVRALRCSAAVRACSGMAAVTRGPTVYCMEAIDNGSILSALSLSDKPNFSYENGKIYADGFRDKPSDKLYSEAEPEKEKTRLTFIPFRDRLCRGETEMSVFVRI